MCQTSYSTGGNSGLYPDLAASMGDSQSAGPPNQPPASFQHGLAQLLEAVASSLRGEANPLTPESAAGVPPPPPSAPAGNPPPGTAEQSTSPPPVSPPPPPSANNYSSAANDADWSNFQSWFMPAASGQPPMSSDQSAFGPTRRRTNNGCHCSTMSTFLDRFLPAVGVFVRSVKTAGFVTSVVVGTLLAHLLLPGFLLHTLAYLLLAQGLGLHMPTLLVGQLVYSLVRVVGLAEPLLLVGFLLWSLHKVYVRRVPLVRPAKWRHQYSFNNFRAHFE